MNDEINELDPNLIVLSSRGATYLNKRSPVILELGDRGTLIELDPFQQGIQNSTCFCSKGKQVNTNYGDYCGFCGGERIEEWTGYPAEYPEFKPSKQCKTEVTESSLPLKLKLLLPPPDDPTCCQLNSIVIAQERAKKFLDKTINGLDSCGHGPKTEEELDAFKEKYQLVMSFLPLMYEYVTNDQGDSGWLDKNGSIRLRPMGSGPEWNEPGTYQIRYHHGVKEGFTKRKLNKRVSENVKDSTVFMAFITGLTTPELKEWLKGKDELVMLIGRITSLSPAFKCHKSNEDEAFMESASRMVEFWISCVTIGDPGYILEKHFDHVDPETSVMFSLESLMLDPRVIWMLQNVAKVMKIKTWITFESALLVRKMMRPKEDGHLMEHLDWLGVSLDILAENNVTYETIDAVDTTVPFELLKRALEEKLLPILRPGNEEQVKRVFDEVIEPFSGESFETYVRPEDDVYQEQCEQALLDVFTNDSHDQSKTVVIEIEKAFMNQLSKSFVEKYLPEENRVETFYRVANVRHNIVVSVTESFFPMASLGEDSLQSPRTRIEQFRSYMMNLTARQVMGIMSAKDFMTQRGIWKAAAINITDCFGTIDRAKGSIPGACHYALGEGGLGNLLAPTGVGMKDAAAVAIVSVLGCEKFCLFVELYLGHKLEIDYKLEIDGDSGGNNDKLSPFQSFLQTMKTDGAGKGKQVSQETRDKLKGNTNAKGRVVSKETRVKISKACKGRVVSKVTRAKISTASKGRVGRVVSQVTRKKISAACKGRVFSRDTREKLSAAHKGEVVSQETCAKIENDAAWEEMYNQLAKYKADHGVTRVPQSAGTLGRWVNNQRLRLGKKRTMRQNNSESINQRINKLDSLGFEW